QIMNCFASLKNLAFAAAALVLVLGSAQKVEAFQTVVIDAGHGGYDFGAAESYIYEKHLNLDVARRLDIILRKNGIKTVLVRSRDNFVPLSERANIANRYSNSVFVSMHFNHSWKTSIEGIEIYYRSSKGKTFANMVQAELCKQTGSKNRGTRYENYAVIRRTHAPAILVEGGFVSNAKERKYMMDPRFRQTVAQGIADGILKYKKAK
ncbi:MAG: N-acetylmuramoyl-L-alanine amidase, partial [Verrucomicrobiota bacterium]